MFCMPRSVRRACFVLATLAVLGVPLACRGWQPVRTTQMQSHAGPDATYGAVRKVIADEKYQVVAQNDAERTVTVRSHVDEDDSATQSLILIQTNAEGKVTFTPSGYLVHPDGKVHRRLNNEIDELGEAVAAALAVPSSVVSAGSVASAVPPAAVSTAVAKAWNEPAYDPKIWGPGDFTCLPVKLPVEAQQTLKLQLSNGEVADLVLSLAYAPELCRSPAQCPLATGCPALGLGDPQQVNKLAQRLVDKEIGEVATLLDNGRPVVSINLASHGLVAKAMAQLKPAKKAPAGGSWQ